MQILQRPSDTAHTHRHGEITCSMVQTGREREGAQLKQLQQVVFVSFTSHCMCQDQCFANYMGATEFIRVVVDNIESKANCGVRG
jgi:hypothetical protein